MKAELKLNAARAVATVSFLSWACLAAALLIPSQPSRAQVSVPGQPIVPLGYCQLTSIDTAAALSACSGGIPDGAAYAVIQPEAQAIRYRDDATNPTTSVGVTIAVGVSIFYAGTLSKVRVIAAVSGAKLNVLFYR